MEVVELEGVGAGERDQVIAREEQPWGGEAEGEALEWAEKERHLGLRGEDGRLLALAGLIRARVGVDGVELPVVGVGGVIVTRSKRGKGLSRPLLERALELAAGLGPAHAMLFCREPLMAMYAKFGFQAIEPPVRAQQESGPVEMPMRAMWRALHDGAVWPAGTVTVLGLPF